MTSLSALDMSARAPLEASSDDMLGQTLRRWMALGTVQRRVADSLMTEVKRTSLDIGAETSILTTLFQDLAIKADAQNKRVATLSATAGRAEMDGKEVALTEVVASFDGTLSAIVQKILSLSKNAMAMVYAFDEVAKSMTMLRRAC
jgi:methyl-accepting chemotaxis protein